MAANTQSRAHDPDHGRTSITQEVEDMKRTVATLVLVLAVAVTPLAIAQSSPGTGRATLAKALQGAWLPLESGLIASSTQEAPLSGKYEIDDGAFQLSVYTVRVDPYAGDTFMEVIVDYNTGTITRAEVITDGGDLAAARDQKLALAAAKRTLESVTASVVKGNAGYRAVSVVSSLNDAGLSSRSFC